MRAERERSREEREISLCCVCEKGFCRSKKINHLLLADCRHLIHLFFCRCLQMWSADRRPFPAEKTNNTLVNHLMQCQLPFCTQT
ncbi:hypothetical protein Hanom_Chr03g00253201 [Helianthus anomalus]